MRFQQPDAALTAKAFLERLKADKDGCYNELVEMNVIQHAPEDFRGRNVLDAGAFVGTFTAIAVVNGASFVLAVESNPENCLRLFANVRDMSVVKPLHAALTDGKSDHVFPAEAGSISKVRLTGAGPRVPAYSLGRLLEFFPRGDNDLVLKIDIEGSEFEALPAASRDEVRRFRTIFAEFHGEPPPSPHDLEGLKAHMAWLGYSIVGDIKSQYWWDWDASGKVVGCKKLPIETIKYKREA